MSDNVLTFKKSKNENPSEKVESFISKNRKSILTVAVIVIAAAIAVAAFLLVKNNIKEKNLAAVDEIEFVYTNKSSDLTDEELTERQDVALASLEEYLSLSGTAGVRANLLAASIAYDKADFAKAASYYEAAALADEKAYTAGTAYFNAASAYEQLSDDAKAKDFYLKASEVPEFLSASHALFNVARLTAKAGNTDEAKALYQKVIDTYADTPWAELSQTYLIEFDVKESR